MYRFTLVALIVFIYISYSAAYKWISLKPDDPIPQHAVSLDSVEAYVGRAIHYNLVLPAEVYNSTYSVICFDYKQIVKHQFEILVATENCEWTYLDDDATNVPENVVRAGTAWDGEPIYIGKSNRLASMFLTSGRIKMCQAYDERYTLICQDDDGKWIDSTSGNTSIPSHAVYGGQTEDNNDIFVARLLGPFSFVPGQVIPKLNMTTAVYNGYEMRSSFCQVLVGDSKKYKWRFAKNGKIPDYAVAASKNINGELMYPARINRSLGYITHSEALAKRMAYSILTKNVD